MKKKDFDVIIIGAGASGAAAAWNLSTTNLKILCLEQGPVIKKNHIHFFKKIGKF